MSSPCGPTGAGPLTKAPPPRKHPPVIPDHLRCERWSPTPLLYVFLVDTNRLGVDFLQGLTPGQYDLAQDLVNSIPHSTYSVKRGEVWMVSLTPDNLDFFLANKDKIDFTDEAWLAVDVKYKTAQYADLKAERKWKFMFEDELPEIEYEPAVPSYRHQIAALDAIHDMPYGALFMEMGTGKTKIVIDEIAWQARIRMKEAEETGFLRPYRVMIVCPRRVRYAWIGDEFENFGQLDQFMPEDVEYYVDKISTRMNVMDKKLMRPNREFPEVPLQVFMASYDQIASIHIILQVYPWDLIVLDESHRIKGFNAKRTKAILEMAREVEDRHDTRKLILTGTPVVNNLTDLFCQFEFMEKGSLGFDTYHAFKSRYGNSRRLPKDKLSREWQNVAELKTAMSRYAFIVRKEQCLDLPPKSYERIEFDLSAQQRQAYLEMEELFFAETENAEDSGIEATMTASSALSRMTRFSQITSGFLNDLNVGPVALPGGNPRVETLVELLEEVDPASRVIIWTRFRYDRAILKRRLMDEGYEVALLQGSDDEMNRIVTRFNSDPRPGERMLQVVIGDATSAGEGLTLLGTKDYPCYTVVYYSSDFSLGKRLQSEDRVHRPGQEHPVTYYDIIGVGTIDEYVYTRLREKRELADEIKNTSDMRKLLSDIRAKREKREALDT